MGGFAAGAAAFALLYPAITAAGRKRKKRGIKDNIIEYFDDAEIIKIMFRDVLTTGMAYNFSIFTYLWTRIPIVVCFLWVFQHSLVISAFLTFKLGG